MGKKIIITRKIELRIDSNDASERKEAWRNLFRWRDICVQGANKASTHYYCQQQQAEFVYLSEKASRTFQLGRPLTEEEGKEVSGLAKEVQREALTTSPQNTSYQVLSRLYKGQIPCSILASLCNNVFRTFQKERGEYATGARSLRNYKSSMPIPFAASDLRKLGRRMDSYNGREYENFTFQLFGVPFQTWFGRDLSNNKAIFKKGFSKELLLPGWLWAYEDALAGALGEEGAEPPGLQIDDARFTFQREQGAEGEYSYIVEANRNGEACNFKMKPVVRRLQKTWEIASDYKFCSSAIALEASKPGKNNSKQGTKIFLLACFEIEQDKRELDNEQSLECYLSPETPIKAMLGDKVLEIGNKEEFLYRRQALQQAHRRLQVACRYNKPGVRRSRKLQALDKVAQMESNYVGYKTHMYSKRLIDIAVKTGAGRIILKGQSEKESVAKEDEALLRNWSYFDLKTKIINKAARVGIVVEVE